MGRWQVEKSNTVELVMDYRAAKILCRNADYPFDVSSQQARDRGSRLSLLVSAQLRILPSEDRYMCSVVGKF